MGSIFDCSNEPTEPIEPIIESSNTDSNGVGFSGIMGDLVARGLATHIRFRDIDKIDYKGNPPPKRDWFIGNSYNTMNVHCSLNTFQKHIQHVLSSIECIQYHWNPAHCCWHIEYGTRPIEYGKSYLEHKQIENGRFIAHQAAAEAYGRFPHNHEEDDNNVLLDGGLQPYLYNDEPKGWGIMELRIYNDIEKKCLFIHLNRSTGSRVTNTFVWRQIQPYFEQNKVYISRQEYLEFIEGTAVDDYCHIQRYLMDTLVAMDICTNLEH